MVRLEAGSGTVTIYKSVGAGQSRHTIANFIVPDVDAAVARLRDRGVTFDEYDVPNIKTDGGIATVGRVRGAWFKDADGNIISVGSYGQ